MGKMMNNGKKKNNTNGNRRTKEEYEAIKAAQLALQGKNLDVIESIAEFLDQWLQSEKKSNRITMKEILNELNNVKGYSADDTKAVSQYSYLLMELANARNNKYVSGDRINIRIMYIEERMKTSFKKELHDRAIDIVDKYNTLFFWDEQSNAEEYQVLGESDHPKE